MWPRVDGLRGLELGTPGHLRARLTGLVLAGAKTATAGRLADYSHDGEELESVGEHLAMVDDGDRRLATVEVTEVVVRRFVDVPEDFAYAEGEGFTSLTHWRDAHAAYWRREGAPVTDDEAIVCIGLRVVDRA